MCEYLSVRGVDFWSWKLNQFCLSAENQTKYNVETKHRHPFNLIVQFLLFLLLFPFLRVARWLLLSFSYMDRIISKLIQTFMMIMATRSGAQKKHHRCAAFQLIKTIRTLAAGIICIFFILLFHVWLLLVFIYFCVLRSLYFVSFRPRAHAHMRTANTHISILLECTDYYHLFCTVVVVAVEKST